MLLQVPHLYIPAIQEFIPVEGVKPIYQLGRPYACLKEALPPRLRDSLLLHYVYAGVVMLHRDTITYRVELRCLFSMRGSLFAQAQGHLGWIRHRAHSNRVEISSQASTDAFRLFASSSRISSSGIGFTSCLSEVALMACRLRRQAAVNRAPQRRVSPLRARTPHACALRLLGVYASLKHRS